MGASSVSTPADSPRPESRRRMRRFSGYNRNARKAAHTSGRMNGTKISVSAYPRTAATTSAKMRG